MNIAVLVWAIFMMYRIVILIAIGLETYVTVSTNFNTPAVYIFAAYIYSCICILNV